jgi:hypothetical protein
MFKFIPLEYYTAVYYTILLVIVVGFFIRTQVYSDNKTAIIPVNKTNAFTLFAFIVLYMGLRPISGYYFGDMGTYAHYFELLSSGDIVDLSEQDTLFNLYTKLCSSIMSVHAWFLLTAFIYVGCLFFACKRIFPNYVFIAFLMCVTAFSFWSYGVNGIRNGMATSLVILAVLFLRQKWKAIILCILAIGFHKSVMLPVCALAIAYFYKNTRIYVYVWLFSIVLSVLLGGFFENFFSSLGLLEDERFSRYLTSTEHSDSFSSTGFRWDFLLYSMVPIIMGIHVVLVRKQKDQLYLLLLNTYIIANAFWVLVIRASFSNRFAYLSWFLYPLVLIYPTLKFNLWKKQYAKIGIVVFLHFLFTYVMWLIE